MASLLSLRQISRKGKKREGEKEKEKKKRKNRITLHESTPHHRLHDNIRNDCVEFSLSLSLSLLLSRSTTRRGDSASFRRFNLAWKMCWRACARRITRSPRGIYTSSIGCMERGTLRAVAPIYPTFLCRESFSASLSFSPSLFPSPLFQHPTMFFRGRWLFTPSQPPLLSARSAV